MSYKSFLLLFFTLIFSTPQIYAGIPIQPTKTAQARTLKKVKRNKPRKKERAKNPNINGLLSFIFGIAGLFFPLFSIPALILGIISLNKREPKKWMGITGVVLGGLVFLISLAVILFFLLVFL